LKYTEKEKNFLERRSMENLIVTYRQELLRIVEGDDCFLLLPRGVRRRFRRCGILLKIRRGYEVTPKGKKMLSVIDDAE